MKINFDIHSLDNSIEKFVLKKLNIKPPDSYNKISSELQPEAHSGWTF